MSELLASVTDLEVLMQILGEQERNGTWELDPAEMELQLKSRVRGQDHVIDDLVSLISRQYAKVSRRKPVASLLFLGPTGTGKSELCKALAECLFEDEKSLRNYDCGQFKDSSGISRLVGSPQGYVGGSGELTKAMLANKRRLVAFDEIEKAHSSLFDLFLSMMGDGRLADQRTGREADFTESIIVLTSNAEQEAMVRIQNETTDPDELNNALRVHLRESGTFRPEIIGRIDRIYVFNELEGIVEAEIVVLKMRKLAAEYGLTIAHVDAALIYDAMQRGNRLKDFGARQREQVVEDMLAEQFLAARRSGAHEVEIHTDNNGELHVTESTCEVTAERAVTGQ